METQVLDCHMFNKNKFIYLEQQNVIKLLQTVTVKRNCLLLRHRFGIRIICICYKKILFTLTITTKFFRVRIEPKNSETLKKFRSKIQYILPIGQF